jgi:dTDP-4-amino-4,6-dideoxygalactose transaminase
VSHLDGHVRIDDFTYFRGRVALAALLRCVGVKPGHRVALQAFTCVAVPEAVLSVGAVPVYVDTEPGSFNMDPADLVQKLTRDTTALVVQHTFGIPAQLGRLLPIARDHGLPVLEDCAHTIASRLGGRLVGTFGVGSFYSYEAGKPLVAGLGGSAHVNDAELRQRLEADYQGYLTPPLLTQLQILAMLVAHKIAYRPTAYWTVRTIYRSLVAFGVLKGNYNAQGASEPAAADFRRKLGGLQLSALRRQITRLDRISGHQRWVADQYRRHIVSPHAHHPSLPPGAEPAYGRYPLTANGRDALLTQARSARVEVADFYATPVHPLAGGQLRQVGYEIGSCPNAEALTRHVISLPTGPRVGRREVERSVDFLNAFTP